MATTTRPRLLVALLVLVGTSPAFAQFLSKPTRPNVALPVGEVRRVILKDCTRCHGIDDYAYNALDPAGWNALLESKHDNLAALVSSHDREVLLDWLVVKLGPKTKPFPRTYVPPEITTFFSDAEAQALLNRACVTCHDASRFNDARYSPDRWRVSVVDMRERGARISDEELERLVEWLGRVKGTNPNQ
jgi:hypothetical protein